MIDPAFRDRLGKPVPSRLRSVWKGRESILEMRRNLHQWHGALAGAVGGANTVNDRTAISAFSYVPITAICELVQQIDDLLVAHLPQVACRCKHKYCPHCEGKGWLNAQDARRISSQGQLPSLSASLSPRPFYNRNRGEWMVTRAAAEISLLETTRSLWLLAGPPPVSLQESAPGTASTSRDAS